MYGRSEAEVTSLSYSFDGNLGALEAITSNNFTSHYFYDREEDGDHQFMMDLDPLNGTFLMSHLECGCPCSTPSQVKYANNIAASRIDNTSGDGFDLLTAGPTAQNVPAQAVIVDNIDSAIIYHNQSQWITDTVSIRDYGGSASYTSTPGASLSFSFDGVAIWYDCVSHDIPQPNVA